MIALDTNVLLAMARSGEQADQIRLLLEKVGIDHRIIVSTGVFREFHAVATRAPSFNGLGLSVEVARRVWTYLTSEMAIVHEDPTTHELLSRLIQTHGITGFRVHDAYHVAVALTHGATNFLTFDQEDFAPFAAEIQLIHPNDLAGTQDLA